MSTGDYRVPARDALAIVTSLVPMYLIEDDVETEAAWHAAQPVMRDILKEQSTMSMITLVAHVANMAAHLAVRADPEDPYSLLQEIAKEIG